MTRITEDNVSTLPVHTEWGQFLSNINSSSLPFDPHMLLGYSLESFDITKLSGVYMTHKLMLRHNANITEASDPALIAGWVLLAAQQQRLPESSSDNLGSTVEDYYAKAEGQLLELYKCEVSNQVVEKSAVESALLLIGHFKKSQLPPPELSWHGGDAVVMLWSVGDTTCAITVTEGEFGYVARQKRRFTRILDSIPLKTFMLKDTREKCLLK